MNPDTLQLKELAPDEPPPEGFVELPAELQSAAAALVGHAHQVTSTHDLRAQRKRQRQNRRKGRGR